MKTKDLSGPALDWAVCKAQGFDEKLLGRSFLYHWKAEGDNGYINPGLHKSTNWSQGGPIIDREKIGTWPSEKEDHEDQWGARMLNTYITYGPTPLVAAMRCYVASKLGDDVEVPEELL